MAFDLLVLYMYSYMYLYVAGQLKIGRLAYNWASGLQSGLNICMYSI